MNTMNKNNRNSSALKLEKDLIRFEQNKNFASSKSNSHHQSDPQAPLLPRYGWQDQQAFAKTIMKAKRLLDIAEITAYLD